MDFIDTHIHLQDIANTSLQETISALQKAGIKKCICVSAREHDWEKILNLYNMYPQMVVPAFGVHPWYAAETRPGWETRLATLLEKHPHALIGECGLDRLRQPALEDQRRCFQIQIQLAKQYRRTLLIHAVKAQEWLENFWLNPPACFVFHSFNARLDLLNKIVQHGGYAAFNMNILKNKTMKEILQAIPANRILLESDAPYQSSPQNIPLLAAKIANIRGDNLLNLAQTIYNNSMEIIAYD